MNRWTLWGAALLAAMVVATPAVAQPAPTASGDTITATGIAQTRVRPKDRNSNASIAAAVDRAHRASIAGALREAHEYAAAYARAVHMKLGSVISVSDAPASGFYAYGPAIIGPFGPGRYCGTVRQPVGKPVKGQPRKLKAVHRCFVPPFASASLTVTYSAS